MLKVKSIILGLLILVGSLNIASGYQTNEASETEYACTDLLVDIFLESYLLREIPGISTVIDERSPFYPRSIGISYILTLRFDIRSTDLRQQPWNVFSEGTIRFFDNISTAQNDNINSEESNLQAIRLSARGLVRNTVENGLQNMVTSRNEYCDSNDERPLSNVLNLNSVQRILISLREGRPIRRFHAINITDFISDIFLTLAPEYGFSTSNVRP